jgi:hypothetical protein
MKPAQLVLPFLMSVSVSMVSAQVFGQNAQISEGVRVMAPSSKDGSGGIQYYINSQPPVSAYLRDTKLFKGEADLLSFFRSLPAGVQERGLWVTPATVRELQTEEDRQRINRLVGEARKQNVVAYICAVADLGGPSGLAGWECTQESPSRGSEKLRCIPRDKPHLGHPWWDC